MVAPLYSAERFEKSADIIGEGSGWENATIGRTAPVSCRGGRRNYLRAELQKAGAMGGVYSE